MQDPKLHAFGKLEGRVNVVGDDEGVDFLIRQMGLGYFSIGPV